MSDKTFKERVREEIANFPAIYADFKEEYKAGSEEGLDESVWLHLFGVPFDGRDDQPNDHAKRALGARHRHDAVKKAVQELGVSELRLGKLVIKNYEAWPAGLLIEQGILTPDDVVPPSGEHHSGFGIDFDRAKPDHRDPFFWRALLEVFCRAFVASRGRRPWPLIQIVDLAFDLDDIRRNLPKQRWNKKKVMEALRKEPYITKYPESTSAAGSADVGEDRIQQITDVIGPMNDQALANLKKFFPEEFSKVVDLRSRRKKVHELTKLAEDLAASSPDFEEEWIQLMSDLLGPIDPQALARLETLRTSLRRSKSDPNDDG
jgi:hypothetical protein